MEIFIQPVQTFNNSTHLIELRCKKRILETPRIIESRYRGSHQS